MTASVSAPAFAVPEDHLLAARRYIDAIVATDRLVEVLGDGYADERRGRLESQYVETYGLVASGPYARRGDDAHRIAMSQL